MLTMGAVFAGYLIEGVIGEGGMGAVYLARHPRLPRKVALKVLHPALGSDPTFVELFEQEAAVACKLRHPSIVNVYDRGVEDGQLWIAMEYIEGTDAGAELRMNGPMPFPRVRTIVAHVADALDHAHARNLVHRDVKPDNILLPRDARSVESPAMLADFGIAAVTDRSRVTQAGAVAATLAYAPLEQLEGGKVDGRADVYALGAVTFELLTGRRPFSGLSLEALYAAKIRGQVPDLAPYRPDLAGKVNPVIAWAMSLLPADRYATCREFAQDLERAAATEEWPPPPPPPPPRPRPVPWWKSHGRALVIGVLTLLVLIGGGVAFLLWPSGGPGEPIGLSAVARDEGITLHWNRVEGADHYQVLRNGDELDFVTETTYVDADVEGGQEYRYSVLTLGHSGDRSDPVEFPPVTALLAPPELAEPSVDELSVTLTWEPVTGADHYEVQRNGEAIADGVEGTRFTDPEADIGEHDYAVTAVDADGDGGESTSTVSVEVAPWGTMQPLVSELPGLVPHTPSEALEGPLAYHTCDLVDPIGIAIESIQCYFDNGISVWVHRYDTPALAAQTVDFDNLTATTDWNCGGARIGVLREGVSGGVPLEQYTFEYADPALQMFDLHVKWTADHTVEELRSTFFVREIVCN
jgi:serine/threonine-protein kinase